MHPLLLGPSWLPLGTTCSSELEEFLEARLGISSWRGKSKDLFRHRDSRDYRHISVRYYAFYCNLKLRSFRVWKNVCFVDGKVTGRDISMMAGGENYFPRLFYPSLSPVTPASCSLSQKDIYLDQRSMPTGYNIAPKS